MQKLMNIHETYNNISHKKIHIYRHYHINQNFHIYNFFLECPKSIIVFDENITKLDMTLI